ncbi:U2 snRNP complex subunit, partial [Claviceps citrina]
ILGKKTKTVLAANGSAQTSSKLSRIKLTEDEKRRLQERIRKATSLHEIIALEKELNEGRLPAGIHGDAMEE